VDPQAKMMEMVMSRMGKSASKAKETTAKV
jgi:hypothetical protein